MTIGLLSAPTNLGLRPPAQTSVPGCAKAPEALREAGLHRRLAELGAQERGVVLPGRYADEAKPGELRNQLAIVEHARRLADRIGGLRADGLAPLVLGGDCSILVAAGLALRRTGRHGLVHLDGHTDFRHPGNSELCASLAGEDLAAAVGRHWPAVADLDGLAPYFDPADVVHAGCRDYDEELQETRALLGAVIPASRIRHEGVERAAHRILEVAGEAEGGYWLHLDVDILDPSVMPSVDSPDPDGLDPDELTGLLTALAPRAIGAQVTVFDPDLDPDGGRARLLADILVAGLADLGRDA
ncbi:arginase family protein [Actinomadura sp. DC4]|uniref:arginase family protein n=1 Tax=Actinomadura sp. DC4 TaxID=3055069 RepID=UPI0025B24038|nr:arginase family protein [Actinomadura sp. DC4]MDN3352319.1 arginase family protein [Actinomadura sp. DC4]